MGHISSKNLKSDFKTTKSTEDKSTETSPELTEIPDVRSQTDEINRTPIIFEKRGVFDGSMEKHILPLKSKSLINLKLDPRSPTAGIYRTPILIEDSCSKERPDCYDSPISIYSCDLNDSLSQDIMTPIEPSVNVSGFEETKEKKEFDLTLEPEKIAEEDRKNKNIKIADKPSTYEARRLLDEILSEEENFVKKVPLKKEKKLELKIFDKKLTELKNKSRTPLSNITSSTNSPNQVNAGEKICNKNKILAESGSENASSPSVKYMAQWDQNTTVII